MKHKDKIQDIQNISWPHKNPFDIGYVSNVTGNEFAESLLIAHEQFPDNKLLTSVVKEELWTTNLKFGHYTKQGHHVHFLYDFFLTNGLFSKVSEQVAEAGKKYLEYMRNLSPEHRAMTVFSRELELPGIFTEILKAHDWKNYDMEFYAKYLSDHIYWDSAEDGHGDKVKDFHLNPDVLYEFYHQRLLLYVSIPDWR